MKKLILSIGTLLAIMATTGCDNHSPGLDYHVSLTLDKSMRHDSATLLVLEDGYNQLRVCGAQRSTSGTFTFSGQTDRPKVALIRWDNDSTRPFYFVLESGDINITINPGSWDITGSAENSRYLHYINQRNSITNARVATWQEYLKMATDSSLKHDDEVRMVRQDSLLNDSLQRITVDCINRGDAVGRIVKQCYGQQLDQRHMRQLQ